MLTKIQISVLRGVCQTPAYVAFEKGFFAEAGIDVRLDVAATAWLVPHKLVTGESHFGVIPWTRVAAAEANDIPLVLLAGSGCEEAAIVLRTGVAVEDVKSVAVPRQGGMKDLTAMGMLEMLGWENAERVRMPSGDGAILALVGQGADAASMIEPYATMLEKIGIGTVIKRTGDVWPGAPGCSLASSVALTETEPAMVQSVVDAFVRGAHFVQQQPDEAAEIAAGYIGMNPAFIREALRKNLPNLDALRNQAAMDHVMTLMQQLGYVSRRPQHFMNLSFLDKAQAASR
ncbi:MAG: ABC transporter substrate-binding protein [Gemmatimonadaceae bacterium]|nr:ABC transporter substrate-binding protein [Gemmatimonadaceae bacterium]